MRPADPHSAVGEALQADADAYQGVDETLQADVMRFMAIIAFCLIAILALVRSVEPPAASEAATVEVPHAPPAPAAERAPAVAEEPPVESAAAQPAARQPVAPPPEQQAIARTAPAEPAPPDPAPAPAAQTEEEGLSLRFASDRDFLRLVSRGDIRVFAFNDAEVLSLDAEFRFQPATAPGRVHELVAETIPELVVGALRRRAAPDGYHWGIAMPDRLARQIRGYVDGGATGELVINRFGEVRHHEA